MAQSGSDGASPSRNHAKPFSSEGGVDGEARPPSFGRADGRRAADLSAAGTAGAAGGPDPSSVKTRGSGVARVRTLRTPAISA